MNYLDYIQSCENILKITQPVYMKTYDNFYSICKNYLLSRGYEINNNEIIIPKNDQAFISLNNIAALVFSKIMIDENEKKPSLKQANYFGVDKDGILSTLSAMSLISLQKSCEENLNILKSRFPMRELDAVKLCLFMLLFYDLKLYELAAITAAILYSGDSNDIDN